MPETADTPAVLYIDLHLIHEVTSPQAFSLLRSQGLKVRRPDRTLATMDHSTPTDPDEVFGRVPIKVESAAKQVRELEKNCREFGVELLGLGSDQRGIVHVIGPELGATQPGKTIVCGDSHTATHGAFGALAFGIGTTEVGHVLATQCLLQRRPKTLAIEVTGHARPWRHRERPDPRASSARSACPAAPATSSNIAASAIEALSMEERMTVCNMSIEAGARAGMIAPDETTFAYLKGRRFAPPGRAWDRSSRERWSTSADRSGRALRSASSTSTRAELEPMITYGTHPGMVVPITGARALTSADDRVHAKALALHGPAGRREAARQTDPGRVHRQLHERAACPISQLAAQVLKGRKVAPRRSRAGRPGFAAGQARSRSRGLGEDLHRCRRRVARVGLLDVHRHERRPGRARPIRCQHEQSQFRRPARQRRTHVAGESGDCCRRSDHRQDHRSARFSLPISSCSSLLTPPCNPSRTIESRTVVLPSTNIDTDQIIPARFLTTTTKEGLGKHAVRRLALRRQTARRKADFLLNKPEAPGCQILVAGRNFGCGSSREHAPWALLDFGFRAVISTEIADIFRSNSLKNGLLPIVVDEATHQWLLDNPGAQIRVDLAGNAR